MRNVEAWLDWRESPQKGDFFPNHAIDGVFLDEMQTDFPESFNKACERTSIEYNSYRVLMNRENKLIDKSGKIIGAMIEIGSATGQNQALSLVGSVEWIIIDCTTSWQMIPVENLIAACDGSVTRLAVFVDKIENLSGTIFSLQLGPHAIILPPIVELWDAYKELKLKYQMIFFY